MKSFEELFNEFNNDEEIKKIGEEVIAEVKKKRRITLILCLILTAVLIYSFKSALDFTRGIHSIIFLIVPIMMINLIIIVVTTGIFSKKQRQFLPVFKEKVIKKMINSFLNDMEYFPSKKISERFYKEANYNENYDEFYSDDYIEAKIDNKYFIDMAEVKTERIEVDRDSDGNTTTRRVTVFHGLFAKIEIEKNINTDLRIMPNNYFYKNRLEMDSSEFEKYFDVYTSDNIKGMQILTADIMDNILEFKHKTKYCFDIYVKDDTIYLRFHCGSLFEPHFRKNNILDENSLKSYYNILNFTCGLTNKIIKAINDVEI